LPKYSVGINIEKSMAIEARLSSPELLASAVAPGEVAARFSLTGSPDSDLVESTAVIAEIDTDQINYDDAFPGVPVVHYATAVRLNIKAQYGRIGKGLAAEILSQARSNLSFHHNDRMLLSGPLLGDQELIAGVAELTDNESYRALDYSWQVSTIGLLPNLRSLSRELFVASGQGELNEEPTTEALTNPRIRADLMSCVANLAFNGFMNMPPSS